MWVHLRARLLPNQQKHPNSNPTHRKLRMGFSEDLRVFYHLRAVASKLKMGVTFISHTLVRVWLARLGLIHSQPDCLRTRLNLERSIG